MLSSGGGSNHTGAESLDGATAIDRRGAESEQTKKCEWKTNREMRRGNLIELFLLQRNLRKTKSIVSSTTTISGPAMNIVNPNHIHRLVLQTGN